MYGGVAMFCMLTVGLVVSWIGLGVHAQQCVGFSDGCGCVMDNGGGVIDVSSLARTDGEPLFKDVLGSDMYYYSYNPCKPFSEGSCSNAAVCQVSSDKQTQYQAGDADSASWSFDGSNPVAFYSSFTDAYRESYVTFICDKSKDTPEFNAIGEPVPTAQYYFEVRTKCACPNTCGKGGGGDENGEDEGLSVGSILVIIVVVLFFVYIVAGIVFKRTQRQATGAEMVPNIDFWRALPGLVKDGFVYSFNKARGGFRKTGYDEV